MTSCSTVSTQLDGVSYFEDHMHETGIHGEPDSADICVHEGVTLFQRKMAIGTASSFLGISVRVIV